MAKNVLGSVRRKFQPWNDPAAKPFIEFRGVTKRFGTFVAVDNQSLNIYEREFHALLGPSGCGKTTLLRMLAGFEEPTEGSIWLDGKPLSGVPPHKRPVNMMFQSYALFPHMTVEANVAFGLKQDKLPKDEIDARVAEMLKLVKMEQFAKRKPDQLSGGQRQRVALARAVAKRPKVLALDEPLGALDKKLREETQFELISLQETLGLTFVIVTHDQEEAMTVADRISVMDQGRIVQVATPAEIYEAPNCRYVADFIGSVNIFEGSVDAAAPDRTRLSCADGVSIDAATGGATKGATVWFAVRPEKVRIAHDEPAGKNVNAVPGEVWDIAYFGDMTLYNVKLASGKEVRATMMNAHRSVERPITWEDKVWLSWDADAGVVLTSSAMAERQRLPLQRRIVTWIPYVWLLIFFLAPFLIVLKISVSEVTLGQPPYLPVFNSIAEIPAKIRDLSFANYAYFFSYPLYWKAYLSSAWIALVSTAISLLVGYPIAYGMARARPTIRPILVMLVILPFWTSFLIRVYALIGILKPDGLLTLALQSIGILGDGQQVHVMNTNWAVYIGIVYSYLPFMVLPLYASLEKLDRTLLEAASDLGSPPWKSFWQITFPLSLPGVIAGAMLVFIPATGEFVIPDLLGGSDTLMIGKTLWDEFFHNRDWPMASTVATILLIVLVVPIVFFQNTQAKNREQGR